MYGTRRLTFPGCFCLRLCLVATLLDVGVARAEPHSDKPANEVWQVIYLGKGRIGYSRVLSRPMTIQGHLIQKTEAEMRLSFKRFGQPLRMEMRQETEESADGTLLNFLLEIKNPPAAPTRTTGRVEGNRLVGEMNVGGTAREYSIPWEAGIKSAAYLDRLPRERPLNPGAIVSLRVFLPEQMQISDVRLSAGRKEPVLLLNGHRRTLQKVTTVESVLPQSAVQSYLDERGQTVVSTTEMLGQTLTSYTVTAGEALKEVAGEELDLAVSTLVQSKAIPHAHQTKRAVYRIKMHGEDPTPFFPNGPNQKVIRTGVDECRITVLAAPPAGSNRNIRVDRQYLAGSRYLQTTDPAVMMHADQAARGITDPAQIAVAMEKYVHDQIRKKDFSTALGSAAEVAKSLKGDCTEHAVLLAAMLRVRNIPSRIVVGLVYIEPLAAFGGHMWTEALLGDHWAPLDATLGLGGAGADHIALAESSFADSVASPISTFLPLLRVLGRIELTVVETSLK
jgi:transglutaminase-like putative cysteine protease